MPVSTRPQHFGAQDFGAQHFGAQDFGAQHFGAQDFGAQDFGAQDFFARNIFAQHFSLLEKRSMIDFPIRSCNIKVGPMTFPGDWILSTQRLPIHWRLDFIYTEIADTLVVAGLARR